MDMNLIILMRCCGVCLCLNLTCVVQQAQRAQVAREAAARNAEHDAKVRRRVV